VVDFLLLPQFMRSQNVEKPFMQERLLCRLSIKRKIGVTGHPRSLNPGKAVAMAICPIIVHFIT